ncbi:helix-turn-helix domain-containing protein [Dactylosporangium sp. CA-092794]|uniref:helix-turn-helix domain-containing protein n=1 Tax=Dactylosporangium sp. CA-092794 TaxID=3239929 RepID=UPI003D8FF9B5
MHYTTQLLSMLLEGGSRSELDAVLLEAAADETISEHALQEVRQHHDIVARLRDQFVYQQAREAELSALVETAKDLGQIRDLDRILGAIVARARRLLQADITFIALNDEDGSVSRMRVADGALTPVFYQIQFPPNTGLLGRVARTGEPYFTDDYLADSRFQRSRWIDDAVAPEQIRALLGVPLVVDRKVIGTLLAGHRRVRRFPPSEVALFSAFAAHAALAVENARLLDDAKTAVAAVDAANAKLRAQNDAIEHAALAHDQLTQVLALGGGVDGIGAVLAASLDGAVSIYDSEFARLLGPPDLVTEDRLHAATEGDGARCIKVDNNTWIARAAATDEHLGTVVLRRDRDLSASEIRTLERGALVVALVLLFLRVEAEAELRVRGDLLSDILTPTAVDPERLTELARRHGVLLGAGVSIAVAHPLGGLKSESQASRAAAALASEVKGLGGVHERSIVVLAATPPRILGQRVAQRFAGATVGVAACRDGVQGVREAYRDAAQTMTALLRLGREGDVCDSADLGLTRLLLGEYSAEDLDHFLVSVLGPLLEHDSKRGTQLLETLATWFSTGGSIQECSRRLHVHANTVKQRLERVGVLLGPTWRDPERRVDLQVAIRLHRLRAHG